MTNAGSTETLLQQAERLLTGRIMRSGVPEAKRLDLWLAVEDLVPAIKALVNARWGYLASITGLDHPDENMMEAIYHLCSGAAVLGLRIVVGRDAPTLPSICHLIPSATLLEREIVEMFGFTVTDTPDTAHLYLPENWPSGLYPLRKDAGL